MTVDKTIFKVVLIVFLVMTKMFTVTLKAATLQSGGKDTFGCDVVGAE